MSSNFKCRVHPNYQGIYPPRKDGAGHVCEMCDWVWHASPRFNSPTRPWGHAESTYNLAKGGPKFGDFLKTKAFKLVKVVTDDAQIDLGLLVRDDEEGQIRVGHLVSVEKPYQRDDAVEYLNLKRRPEWRLDAISRDRITEFRVLS